MKASPKKKGVSRRWKWAFSVRLLHTCQPASCNNNKADGNSIRNSKTANPNFQKKLPTAKFLDSPEDKIHGKVKVLKRPECESSKSSKYSPKIYVLSLFFFFSPSSSPKQMSKGAPKSVIHSGNQSSSDFWKEEEPTEVSFAGREGFYQFPSISSSSSHLIVSIFDFSCMYVCMYRAYFFQNQIA